MASINFRDIDNWRQLAKKTGYKSSSLARTLNVSPRQLRRYTRIVFQRSPQAWLNEERLLCAQQMLMNRRFVKGVSVDLGFKQTTHFIRVFKLRFGVTPTAFIENKDREEIASRMERGYPNCFQVAATDN
jgi:AraC-like DNA-binding protein